MANMTFGDFLYKAAKKSLGVAQQVTDAVKEKREEKEKVEQEKQAMESGMYEKDGKVVITSLDGLQSWLTEAQSEASPVFMEVIQTQLQTLRSISSPVLQGMALDSLLQSLYQALENEEDEVAGKNLKNIYSCIIQNLFFFNEAKICYAVQKNKETALSLISQAGEQLSGNVMKISKAMGSSSPLKMSNIFANANYQTEFISKVCGWISDRKSVKKSIEDYRKSLENMFESFDRYSSLLGPSILIQGMLAKYRVELVGMKKQELTKPILDNIRSQKNGALLKDLSNTLVNNSSGVADAFTGFNRVGSLVSVGMNVAGSLASSIGSYMADAEMDDAGDIENLISLIEYREGIISKYAADTQKLQDEKTELEIRKSKLGIFKRSEKKELEEMILAKEKEINAMNKKVSDMKNKVEAINVYVPQVQAIMKELGEYEATLKRIEDEFTLSGYEGDLLKR